MIDYITAEDLKKSVELTGTTFQDRDIERAIPAASRAVDDICSRRFWLDEEPVARRYSTTLRGRCEIDDLPKIADVELADLAIVEIDSARDGSFATTWTYGTDYDFDPMNADADAEPFTDLVAISSSFPAGRGLVRVTARFGWVEIPSAVVQATLLLANRLIVRARQAPFGVVTSGIDVGVAMRIARTDPDVASLLEGVTRTPALRSIQLT